MMLDIFKEHIKVLSLIKENKRLKEELEQKDLTIQYLNACVSRANRRYINLLELSKIDRLYLRATQSLDFPNSSVEAEGQISIHDILEN